MKNKFKTYLLLHLLLMLFSLCGICSKKAGGFTFLSLGFGVYYGAIVLILGIYAVAWQQIIKHLPLTTAYANRAVTIFWGIVWGIVFFNEKITMGKILGCALVITGIVLYAFADGDEVGNG